MHTVYDSAHGGWASQVMVTPGAFVNDSTYSFSAPFGTYSASNWIGYTSSQDPEGDHRLTLEEASVDLAIIGLNVNLGSLTGILDTSFTSINNFQGTVLGYPAQGTGLMEDTGSASSIYNSLYGLDVYRLNVALGAGASGGPLLDYSGGGSPVIRGVLSTGSDYFSNYAGLSGALKQNWYNQTSASNDIYLSENAYRPIGQGITSGSEHSDLFYELNLSFDNNGISEVYGYNGGDIIKLGLDSSYYQYYMDRTDPNAVILFNTYNETFISLHDINALVYQDKTVYVLTEEQAKIARLYTVFDRAPDYDGLNNWLTSYAHGTSFNTIANSFSQSQEFALRYNAVDNLGFAGQLYSIILGRQGDDAGIANWTNALNNGLTRGDAMIQFTNSAENKAITEGPSGFINIVGNNAWADTDSVIQKGYALGTSYADHLYESSIVLNDQNFSDIRTSRGGDVFHLNGVSTDYLRQVDNSDSSVLHLTNNTTNATFNLNDINMLSFKDKDVYVLSEEQAQIARLYTVFDRTPDYNGLQNWLNASSHGMSFNTIANSFSQSQEFALRYNAVDNYGFANQLYNIILGRQGDTAGLATWTNALDHGMTRGDAMIQFTNSTENHLITEGSAGFIQIVGQSEWV
ncbi:serralysin [Pseudomonas asuensis]|uniref:Serralysin n=2 Tax=Pseudomonas asuensis TaxID=1825787 RepID=A0ABQ2GZY0_9PSED|nr:serralysin [Pseudomonas asuensis]